MAIMRKSSDFDKSIINALLDISPEKYYFETVVPLFLKLKKTIKRDVILLDEIYGVENACNSHAIRKEYAEMENDFSTLVSVILSERSRYKYEDVYIQASQEEKDLIEELRGTLQQLMTIIRCSDEPSHDKEEKPTKRLGYDDEKGENIVKDVKY